MNRLPMSTCFWTACMLLAGACSSSPGPTAATSPPAKQAAAALAGADAKASPRWQRTDIAERRFDTDRMFIEQDGRAWRAWAVSRPDKGRVRAMEFFTGAIIEGRLDVDVTSPQHDVLTDDAGKPHRLLADESFQPRPDPGDGNGAMYFGHGDIALDFGDTVFASDPHGLCPLELHVVARQPGKDRADMSSAWAKVAMYHTPPDGDCPSGEWISEVRSALDLQDGTFLVAIGDRLFRLNMADLSAAGQAPTLRIIDAARAQAIAKQIVAEQVDDPNGYLTDALDH